MTRAADHHHSKPAAPKAVQRGPFAGLHHSYADRLAHIADQSGAEASEVREVYEERASQRQYMGGMSQAEAELVALDDTEDVLLRRVVP